jgi:glycosyltransferase involved in cell wall biosynthesis
VHGQSSRRGVRSELSAVVRRMLRLSGRSRPRILFVVHAWGGGTIRFARELACLVADKVDVTWAWGIDNTSFHLSKRGPYFAEKSFSLAAGIEAPLRDLAARQFDRLNVIHTIGLQDQVSALVGGLTVPYDITFTDYHHFSPSPHFEDENGYFVGDEALAKAPNEPSENVLPLLAKADRRIAISGDLAHRVRKLIPMLPVIAATVREPRPPYTAEVRIPNLEDSEVMRLLVLGRPHLAKGLDVILHVARRAQSEGLPLNIYCLGESSGQAETALNALPNVHNLGAYGDADLSTIVGNIDPHLAWLPFTVPETHSYTLSDVLGFGLPILATGIGAVPERLNGRQCTWLVPYRPANAEDHFDWIEKLYVSRLNTPSSWRPVSHLPETDVRFFPDAYLAPVLARRGSLLNWLRAVLQH